MSIRGDINNYKHGAGTSATAIDTYSTGYSEIYLLFTVAATGTVTLTECDTSGGTYTAVDSSYILGSTALATSDESPIIAYIGNKRYIKATVTGTGNTFEILWAAPRMSN
jgi:hypothetical protein